LDHLSFLKECQPFGINEKFLSQWPSLLILEYSSNACPMNVLVMTILNGLFLRDDELLNPNRIFLIKKLPTK
jgi:hypothetical protein